MDKKKIISQSLLVLVLIVAGYFAYLMINHNVVKDTSGMEKGQEVLGLLKDLEKMEVTGEVLSNPVFLSLREVDVYVDPELMGRPNPFAPIGDDDLSKLEDPNAMTDAYGEKNDVEKEGSEKSTAGTSTQTTEESGENTEGTENATTTGPVS